MTRRAPAGTREDPLLLSRRTTTPQGARARGASGRQRGRMAAVSVRSQHTAACPSRPSTRQTRRAPSPPRQAPAPAKSGMSEYYLTLTMSVSSSGGNHLPCA
jgi:hypothetical protein